MNQKPTYEQLEHRVRQLEKEVSEHRLAEQELSIFQRLAETAGYGFGIANSDGKITYVNKSLCHMLGEARPEDTYGNNVAIYYSKQEKEELLSKILPTVFNDGQWVGKLNLLSIEGMETPTIQNIFTIRGEGETASHLANLIIDISDRQQLDEALRGSQATLESIFRAAPIGIGLVSNRILKQFNDRILEMTGYSREELLEQSAKILYPDEEEFEYVGRQKYAQIQQYGAGTVETRWQQKDGKIIDVLMSSTPLVGPNDLSAGVTFTALDITDRKRAEEARRKSEEEARDITMELTLGLSEVFEGLKAISSGDPSVRISETSKLDSITKLKKMVNQAARDLGEIVGLSHEFAMGLAEHFDVLHRVSKGDLAVRVFGTSDVELLEFLKRITNQMIESVAKAMAEQKRAEEALRESEERYRTLAENSQVGIWHINVEGFIIYSNPAMCSMLEVESPNELAGKTYHAFFTPESLVVMKHEHIKHSDGVGSNYEVTMVGKHGGRRNVVISGAPLFSGNGELKSLIGTFTDITERKRAEKALLKSYEELEQKVAQRTADLTKTNELLLIHRKKLRSLAAQLSLAEEKERRRIATEVHDQIGQNLAFAKMKLGELRTSTSSQDRSDTVREIIELINGTIQDTRSLVSELGSPILYELGLVPAVEWLTQQAQNKHKFEAEFKDDGKAKPVSDEVQVFLFQAVRESLANVAKHAKATRCTVSLKVQEDNIRVDVVDNGIGFDAEAVGINPEKGTGFGFFSIRERLEPLGGTLEIHSKPGEGARLTLFAPLRQPLS